MKVKRQNLKSWIFDKFIIVANKKYKVKGKICKEENIEKYYRLKFRAGYSKFHVDSSNKLKGKR